MTLPAAISPADLAKQFGWSEKHVRRLAKRLGACRILGNRMALLPDDVALILKATKCPSGFSSEKRSTENSSTTTAGQLPAIDYEDRLAQRTESSRSKLRPRPRTEPTKVVSFDRKER